MNMIQVLIMACFSVSFRFQLPSTAQTRAEFELDSATPQHKKVWGAQKSQSDRGLERGMQLSRCTSFRNYLNQTPRALHLEIKTMTCTAYLESEVHLESPMGP